MNVLALDTCTEQGSVALACDDQLDFRPLPPGWRSTTLHQEIERLLQDHGLASRDIDGYGVTSGPGSFTGVRLGLTAVKGMAEVHAKPIIPVSTLEVIAAAAGESSEVPASATVAAILEARRGQVFGGVYRQQDGSWKAVTQETVSAVASFLKRIQSDPQIMSDPAAADGVVVCGLDVESLKPELEKAGWNGAHILQVSPCLAGSLARITIRRLQRGQDVEAALAEANYIRLSDAELFWKE